MKGNYIVTCDKTGVLESIHGGVGYGPLYLYFKDGDVVKISDEYNYGYGHKKIMVYTKAKYLIGKKINIIVENGVCAFIDVV